MPSKMLLSFVAGHTIRIMKWVFLNHLDACYAMTLIFVGGTYHILLHKTD